ncbi:MAG: LptF/LptG family permease [Petrimonas sp.]|jgi:lipopolysaccharide export system permease protein|nr:LptF/LptG family permease [Petrimonas sp.]
MKIIERYVLSSYLSAVLLSWLVLSFVMTIGLVVRITQLIIQGLPMSAVGTFMLIGFPETLRLTVPISLLVSSLLVFGRLSADSEISAMRACGINLLSVMRWPIIFGLVCTLIGIYINQEVVPRAHWLRRNIHAEISVDVAVDLLEPGKFITDFPDVTIWFAAKEGNWIHDVLIFDHTHKGVTREIRAEKTLVETVGEDIVLNMYKVRIDPVEFDRPGIATADRFTYVMEDAFKKKDKQKKHKDLNYSELVAEIKEIKNNPDNRPDHLVAKRYSVCRTHMQIRYVYAFASLIFVIVGVPLGIRSHRKESTIGIAVSLVVALFFYLGVIFAESMDSIPMSQSHILVWIPFVICCLVALYLVPKNL